MSCWPEFSLDTDMVEWFSGEFVQHLIGPHRYQGGDRRDPRQSGWQSFILYITKATPDELNLTKTGLRLPHRVNQAYQLPPVEWVKSISWHWQVCSPQRQVAFFEYLRCICICEGTSRKALVNVIQRKSLTEMIIILLSSRSSFFVCQ